MDIFDLRTRLVEDYARYTRSFIKIADPRIIEKVDGETIEQLAAECIEAAGPGGYLLGGTTSGTYTERAGENFLRMVDVSKRMA